MPVVIPIALGALAVYQAVNGAVKAKKAQQAMRDMASPTYAQNKAIKDYYDTSLQRAQENPYDSAYYKQAQRETGANLAAGLGALRDRGSSIGNVSRLVGISNRAMTGAGVNAEQIRDNRQRQLGQAAGMQANEDRQAFQVNQYAPYETRFNMAGARAQAGSQEVQAGLSNLANAASSFSSMSSASKSAGYDIWGNVKAPSSGGYGGGYSAGGVGTNWRGGPYVY